jgi:uncharacterized membrane protein YkvA (DUF1232 family)
LSTEQPTFLQRWKERAERLKKEVYALYLAYRDPRTPWYGKVFAALVIAYAFSPIDLIPDPIPILGYLDDLILIPLGVVIALKMGAALVGAIWIALAVVAVWLVLRLLRR